MTETQRWRQKQRDAVRDTEKVGENERSETKAEARERQRQGGRDGKPDRQRNRQRMRQKDEAQRRDRVVKRSPGRGGGEQERHGDRCQSRTDESGKDKETGQRWKETE